MITLTAMEIRLEEVGGVEGVEGHPFGGSRHQQGSRCCGLSPQSWQKRCQKTVGFGTFGRGEGISNSPGETELRGGIRGGDLHEESGAE